MNRIDARFEALRGAARKGVIPFITAGDPSPAATVAIMHALVEGGADLIELGVPFSDPMADGPVIQKASERAIAKGVRAVDVLAFVREFRTRDEHTPVVLMGYLNPVLAFGEQRFFEECVRSGVDGVILPDLPPEEGDSLRAHADAAGVAIVPLLTPTSHEGRMQAALARAGGFAYYVSVNGVTGARAALPEELAERLGVLRALHRLPVAVGFGISTPEQVRALIRHADGVVVGSAIAEKMASGGIEAARAFVGSLVGALERGGT